MRQAMNFSRYLCRLVALLAIFIVALALLGLPAMASNTTAKSNQFWWPDQLDLSPLRVQQQAPGAAGFNYSDHFKQLNLIELKQDLTQLMTDSQQWWPADYGHYGPFFIRMSWHAAGTYRTTDGRGGADGGQLRFEPLNSWPDNTNLDKARRLLWPIKKKYGRQISWADLMVLTGNVALESMGFETFGFAGGRQDDWQADLVYWGPETEMLKDQRHAANRKLVGPLAAVQMGLIYVNPEGPGGKPDLTAAAYDIRNSFGRMAMNDEEIVALIAGGHTFGKAHGAKKPAECLGAEPAGTDIAAQGIGWHNKCGSGHGADTITSGLEGAWTVNPIQWTSNYLQNLLSFSWKQTRSPTGAIQWIPDDPAAANMVPDAHDATKRHAPIMFTTDLALKSDPEFRKIVERFHKDPEQYRLAFAKAWFKLTHRDMGPRVRYLGSEIPAEIMLWQDPVPENSHPLISARQAEQLKQQILASDLTISQLVKTAWSSAATFRDTDMRGGANGARIQLLPQRNWSVNEPEQLQQVLQTLTQVQQDFNRQLIGDTRVSLADTIVLAGAAAIEKAAKDAGFVVKVPFVAGRTDATQQQTDVNSFNMLQPMADAFRNYYSEGSYLSPLQSLVDQADLLSLNIAEMTVLVAGMRVLNTNSNNTAHGVFTADPGQLNNHFLVNLLDMSTYWQKSKQPGIYLGFDRTSGKQRWSATPVDLIFGSHAELRAVAEYYAADDAKQLFVQDFIKAWHKVMMLDRFEIHGSQSI